MQKQTTAEDIQAFIREHALIQGLVRIPFQLDALCYSWDKDFPRDMPRTMTVVYNKIILKL